MKKAKRLLGASLCLALIFTAAGCHIGKAQATASSTKDANFNATGYPLVKTKVTKHFLINKKPQIGNPDSMVVFQEYEKKTNVHIQWDSVNSDGFSERVNLLMASNDMPDAILKGTPDISKCSADGSIIDLTSLISQYAPGLKKLFTEYPAVKAAAYASDGKIYSIPQINTLTPNLTNNRNLWINKKWLDKLGLKKPTTTDELLTVLKLSATATPTATGKRMRSPSSRNSAAGRRRRRWTRWPVSGGIIPRWACVSRFKTARSIFIRWTPSGKKSWSI